jgi:hypothetical protein
MNHTEHNEAVHARLNEILLDKVALALPKQTGNQHAHTKEMLMAGYWAPWAQHIVVTHYGYNKAVEDTANVIAERLIYNLHDAASQS